MITKNANEIIKELIAQFDNLNNDWNQKSAIEFAEQYLSAQFPVPTRKLNLGFGITLK